MTQSKLVLITEIIVGWLLLALYWYLTFLGPFNGDPNWMFFITWTVGYYKLTDLAYKFCKWNFNPENYKR